MTSFGFRFRCTIQHVLGSFLGVVLASAAAGQSSQLAGTLPEDYLPGLKPFLDAAAKQSPQMLLHEIQIARNEARVYEADRERWPNLGGDIRYDSNRTGVSGHSSTETRDSGLFYSFSANQAIFHWGEIKHRGDIARVEVALSQKDYAEGYRLLAIELRRGYLGLIRRRALLEQLRYDLGLKRAQLANAKEQLSHGAIAPGGVASLELDVNEAQLRVDQLETDLEGELRRFCRTVGVSLIPPDQIPVQIPVPRYDAALASELLAAMLRDGGRSTFKAQVDELHIKEADLSYRIARVRLLPKFDASVGHTRESSTTATPTEVSQTAITRETLEIRGNWTIFDGFATKGAKLGAKADRRYWERQRQLDTDMAMDDAQQLERTIALDARAMELAEQRRSGAEVIVKRAEDEMKAGRASQGYVNSAINILRVAEANAATTRATFLSDWTAFVSLVSDDPVLNNVPSRYVRANR